MVEDTKSNEILFSYKKCLKIGLTKSLDAPLISLEEEEMKRKLQENKKLIKVFRKCVNKVRTQLKNRYIMDYKIKMNKKLVEYYSAWFFCWVDSKKKRGNARCLNRFLLVSILQLMLKNWQRKSLC